MNARAPELPVTFRSGEIHVWRISLDVRPEIVRAYGGVLSVEELARARRFVRRADGDRFIACRGAVRAVLGSYLDVAPRDVEFAYSPMGKPEVRGEAAPRFSVSHSRAAALCAVARHGAIGVDVEYVDPTLECVPLAERFFSRLEVASLRREPEARRRIAFFRCWTRKEAYVKAIGRGLSEPLAAFAVSLGPGGAPLQWTADAAAASRWWLTDLHVPDGYAGAVAVERGNEIPIVRHMDWMHDDLPISAGACL